MTAEAVRETQPRHIGDAVAGGKLGNDGSATGSDAGRDHHLLLVEPRERFLARDGGVGERGRLRGKDNQPLHETSDRTTQIGDVLGRDDDG